MKFSQLPVGVILLVATAASAQAATSISGVVNVTANAGIGASTATNSNTASFTGAPATLSTSASATAVSGVDTSTASGAVTATWTSADNGAVDFTNYGWSLNPNAAALTANGALWGPPDWSYTFTATSAGTFAMSYAVTHTGNPFGLWGWNIGWSGAGGGQTLPGSAAYTPDTSGIFTRSIAAGQTYTIDLANNANVSEAAGFATVSNVSGVYNWSINGASAPEPATWAVTLVGLFGLGGALRRRRVYPAR